MRRLLTAAAVVCVLAPVGAAAAGTSVHVNRFIPVHTVALSPCANGGAGEQIELTGRLHLLVTFRMNKRNASGKLQLRPQHLAGVGLTTGARYHATGVAQAHFKRALANHQFGVSVIVNFHLIGQGPRNNLLFHESLHLTITAKGQVTATPVNITIACR